MGETLCDGPDGSSLPGVVKAYLQFKVFTVNFLNTQLGFYTGQSFVEIDGLGNVIYRPGVQSFQFTLLGRPGRDEYYGYGAGIFRSFEFLTNLNAAHSRHHDIQQDEVRRCFLNDIETFLAAESLDNLHAFGAQLAIDQFNVKGLIVNNQNFRFDFQLCVLVNLKGNGLKKFRHLQF